MAANYVSSIPNLPLVAPYSGKKPQVTVAPKANKIIPYKMTGHGAEISFKMGTSFKKGATQMKEKTKSEGNRIPRTYRGQDVGISVFYCKHKKGIVFTYENKSSQYRLIEKVGFNLEGCRIEGFRGSKLKITLEPGETEVLNIVPFRSASDWKVTMTSCRYAIVRTRWNWSWY